MAAPELIYAGKFALGIVQKFVQKWTTDELDKALSSGPAAIAPFRADLDKLEESVQAYCASIQTSAPLLQLPRMTNRDMANACVAVVRDDELDCAKAMITHLQKVRSQMDGVGSAASARNAQRQPSSRSGDDAEEQYFQDIYGAPAGAGSAGRAALPAMQAAMQSSSNTLMMQQKLIILRTLTKSADERLDELIASLNGAVSILQANAEAFRQLAVRCSDWMVSLQGAVR